MIKMLLVTLALAVVTVTLGCGDGTKEIQTVTEYAQWCSEQEDITETADTWGEATKQLEEAADEYRTIKPPEILKDFHQFRSNAIDLLHKIAADKNRTSPFNPFELIAEPSLLAMAESFDVVTNKLPNDVRQQLDAAGCLE